MKDVVAAVASVFRIADGISCVLSALGIFGFSLLIPNIPPLASALCFAVAYIVGFSVGCFRMRDNAEAEADKAAKVAEATERTRIETEAREKRRNLEMVADAEKKAKAAHERESFRARVKSLEFPSKVVLWHIYSMKGRFTDSDNANGLYGVINTLQMEEYIESEEVDFGVTAYSVNDEVRQLMADNDDLFRNAKERTLDEAARALALGIY